MQFIERLSNAADARIKPSLVEGSWEDIKTSDLLTKFSQADGFQGFAFLTRSIVSSHPLAGTLYATFTDQDESFPIGYISERPEGMPDYEPRRRLKDSNSLVRKVALTDQEKQAIEARMNAQLGNKRSKKNYEPHDDEVESAPAPRDMDDSII